MKYINIVGARQHNLKNISLKIPRGSFTVVTGVSGSGKSSLAFDTLFAEGQRRFMESLSSYARQFIEKLDKPDIDYIEGLSPSVSVDQKTFHRNPRSTVGTITEIYDYLRVLFARLGTPLCYECGQEITPQTVEDMVERVSSAADKKGVSIYSPIIQGRKGEYKKELEDLRVEGFLKVRIDGEFYDLEDEIKISRHKKHSIELLIDHIILKDSSSKKRLEDSILIAIKRSGGFAKCEIKNGEVLSFSEDYSCANCGASYPEIAPRLFSFNSPYGACENCNGLGSKTYFDPDLVIEDPSKTIEKGAITPFKNSKYVKEMLYSLAEHYGFSLTTSFAKLSRKNRDRILYGSGDEKIKFIRKKRRRIEEYSETFPGIIGILTEWYEETESDDYREKLYKYLQTEKCEECGGARLNKVSLSITFKGKTIYDLIVMPISDLHQYFSSLTLKENEKVIGQGIVDEVLTRSGFLKDVGLSYLALERTAPTLSGGEAQRIRLATQVGSKLTGITYVLDEPSIGLHQRDNKKLIETLKTIRDSGNTVIVVEHDEETIRSADYIVDIGPGAGEKGGIIVCEGNICKIVESKESITGKYLSGDLKIDIPKKRRKPKKFISIKGAKENNLKNLDVDFPLGVFTCITGVSGSGKSTLVIDTFYNELSKILYKSKSKVGKHKKIVGSAKINKIVDVDQTPIGRTPRSNPATYTGVFTHIRELFAMLPESKVRGYSSSRFSFNLKEGSCAECKGDGNIKIEMHFLPDVYVKCEICDGKRYNDETLQVKYRGKTISDVLNMTVREANEFFENVPYISQKLKVLNDVGLEYIRLGQQATTLSGGEAQRIKLSKELSKRATGDTLYILDEPSVGLHFDDVKKLLIVINKLVDLGNTVIVIEHNLDIIKCADHLIDLGPEGGKDGGYLVAFGTPEKVSKVKKSYTGYYLKEILHK